MAESAPKLTVSPYFRKTPTGSKKLVRRYARTFPVPRLLQEAYNPKKHR